MRVFALAAVCAALLATRPAPVAASSFCDQSAARLATLHAKCDAAPCPPAVTRLLARIDGGYARRCVHLNQLQVLGTHNSYHIRPQEPLWSALLAFAPIFHQWDYTHIPLDQQFETQGIRQIEIDVFADPAGGLYSIRHGLVAVNEDTDSHIPELLEPGFKVLHIQDLDFESTCLTFTDCLQTVKAWSDAHRNHLPIMILIEAKDDVIPDPFHYGFVTPIPIGTAQFDALDAEIRSVFPKKQLITPDDVRHRNETLEYSIRTRGWPTLAKARGKVLFTLDNASKRPAYLVGHPLLAGRVLFTNASPGDDDAAFVEVNDSQDPRIPGLVADGYVVRTRADADTEEARAGNTVPRDAAIASGAQWVSTDYPVENPAFGTGYFVQIPGGMPARCNPVNAPPACRADVLEGP